MSTANIDIMLSKPGIYTVVGRGHVLLVEVDDAGKCFQLNLGAGYSRDVELLPGRWNVATIVGILGPFQRTPEGTA